MKEDVALFAAVALVWALLSLAYAAIPMLDMPGSTAVWGLGALVFALLAFLIGRAEKAGKTA